jgi:phosphoglycerol transferase MdoB-like AlkP superfamily enzyme
LGNSRTIKAIKILALLLLVYFLLRIIFYAVYFTGAGIGFLTLNSIFYRGLKTDITALTIINLPFLFIYFFGFSFINTRFRYPLAMAIVCISNFPFLAINLVDLAYYSFTMRRSTVDLLRVLGGSSKSWLFFLTTYWYWVLLFAGLCTGLYYFFKRIIYAEKNEAAPALKFTIIGRQWISRIVFLLILCITARGWQKKPIMPATALLYVSPQYQPLVNNSSFTFLYSLIRKQTSLTEKNYFSKTELDSLFPIRRQYTSASSFSRKNVVLFIMESFSKEYLDRNSPSFAQTPFLDSLMSRSIVCENAYAGSFESNKAIVGILSGIPSFMDEPLYYSPYSSTPFKGIGTLLKEKGYTTHFFMGAEYDHFGFAKLCKLTGIDNYYSADTYNNAKHHDGHWGIYDHYFFPYINNQLAKTAEPFFASIFNISTHHPYTLPDTLKNQYIIKGQGRAQNSITYYDFVLRNFFEQAKKTNWFKNTIFVFTADHTNWATLTDKTSLYNAYRIPVFFYMPGSIEEHTVITKPVQQPDIIPTILHLLNFNKPFVSFGKSIFDSSQHTILSKINAVYQAMDTSWIIGYDERQEKTLYLYNYKTDTALKRNLINNSGNKAILRLKQTYIKAGIQRYHNSLIRKELMIEEQKN